MRPPIDLPDDVHDVVHPAVHLTTGYLVWGSAEARRLCLEEQRRIGKNRHLVVESRALVFPEKRPPSWVLAMVAADIQEATRALEWASGLAEADRPRLGFFTFRGVDAVRVERAAAKVLGFEPVIVPIEPTFQSFHPVFGRFLSRWTYRDVRDGRI